QIFTGPTARSASCRDLSAHSRIDVSKRGLYLRKFGLFMLVCALFGFASLAHSQQIDIAGGAGTLMSTKNTTASQTYFPPPEKGGTYINFSVDRLRGNHFGLNAEVTWRAKYALYNYYQQYRPILYDLNVVYAPP